MCSTSKKMCDVKLFYKENCLSSVWWGYTEEFGLDLFVRFPDFISRPAIIPPIPLPHFPPT